MEETAGSTKCDQLRCNSSLLPDEIIARHEFVAIRVFVRGVLGEDRLETLAVGARHAHCCWIVRVRACIMKRVINSETLCPWLFLSQSATNLLTDVNAFNTQKCEGCKQFTAPRGHTHTSGAIGSAYHASAAYYFAA